MQRKQVWVAGRQQMLRARHGKPRWGGGVPAPGAASLLLLAPAATSPAAEGLEVPGAGMQAPLGPALLPTEGQPYFPLLLRLFPRLRGGDRALGAWLRFRGLPGPLRAKLLWGSSCLSLKKNHRLGCEPGGSRGAEQGEQGRAHL